MGTVQRFIEHPISQTYKMYQKIKADEKMSRIVSDIIIRYRNTTAENKKYITEMVQKGRYRPMGNPPVVYLQYESGIA